jgi:hypothetical protein
MAAAVNNDNDKPKSILVINPNTTQDMTDALRTLIDSLNIQDVRTNDFFLPKIYLNHPNISQCLTSSSDQILLPHRSHRRLLNQQLHRRRALRNSMSRAPTIGIREIRRLPDLLLLRASPRSTNPRRAGHICRTTTTGQSSGSSRNLRSFACRGIEMCAEVWNREYRCAVGGVIE